MRKLLLMCDNDWMYNCVELHFRMAAHIFFMKCVCWLIFIKTEYINHVIFYLSDLWVCIPRPKTIPTLCGIITCNVENIPHLIKICCYFFGSMFILQKLSKHSFVHFYKKWIKFEIDCKKFANILWYINLVFPRSFI